MGWIDGGSVFEKQIIELYNAKLLNRKILDGIAEPFKETDCDTAGFHDLVAEDGKNAYEIICLIMEPQKYEALCKTELHYFEGEPKLFCNSDEGYALWANIWYKQWNMF